MCAGVFPGRIAALGKAGNNAGGETNKALGPSLPGTGASETCRITAEPGAELTGPATLTGPTGARTICAKAGRIGPGASMNARQAAAVRFMTAIVPAFLALGMGQIEHKVAVFGPSLQHCILHTESPAPKDPIHSGS